MNTVIGVMLALAVLGALFFLLGHCFCGIFQKEESAVFRELIGAVLFLVIFSAVELPMEKLNLPFHVLVYAGAAVFAVLAALCAVYCLKRGDFAKVNRHVPETVMLVLAGLIALQVIYGMNNGIRINGYDTAYYNGHAANALYTDTMFQYNARSGEYIGTEGYVHDGYPMLIAFLAKVFFMHPLVAVNRVLASMEIILMNLCVYEIARRLAKGNQRIANWTVAIHGFMLIWCYRFEEARGFYLWQRTAESKSMLANVYLPLVLLSLVLLAQRIDDRYHWLVLGMVAFAGASLSISGIFVLSAAVGVGLLAIIAAQKKWRYMLNAVLCMLPCMLAGAIRLFL